MANKVGSPRKAGYMREQLERYIFASDKIFETWVKENFTDAVKELGKLQPKNLTVAGDETNPIQIVERLIVDKTTDQDS